MLWVCPFVSADSTDFRYLAQHGMLLLDSQKTQDILWANTRNKAAVIRWWNGASACLDLSNPKAMKWFQEQLDGLVNEYGVDGFKFDAGDANFYTGGLVSLKSDVIPNDHTTFFADAGLRYPLNEYRASWKMAGLPLAQRLRDKRHEWEDLGKLSPDLMSQSMMGYVYTCPDIIWRRRVSVISWRCEDRRRIGRPFRSSACLNADHAVFRGSLAHSFQGKCRNLPPNGQTALGYGTEDSRSCQSGIQYRITVSQADGHGFSRG